MPNRLIHETSPYLRQHAENPVDWYPWGEEAMRRAKEEDKPILLSIGYSACHWCHVMAHESCENPEIARLMNERFISVKVDREERPDVDAVYMAAVQAMLGQGGWPLTVFLTPDGKPFFGGTYYPPEDRGQVPGFPRVLQAVAETYRTRRADLLASAEQLLQHIQHAAQTPRGGLEPLSQDIFGRAFGGMSSMFDATHGGIGAAPKFPQPMLYEFLLRYHLRSGDEQPLQMAQMTLERMARGGLYDQVGGGFHRYSTDTYWLVPHFEKMLGDNALLARLYLHAYQLTGEALYGRIAQETLDYVLREMTSPQGGFYSSQDADSDGEEGKSYVWTPKEIEEALGPGDGTLFCAFLGVTEEGNYQGRNILWVPKPLPMVAHEQGVEPQALGESITRGRQRLLEVRSQRVPPGRDEKVLTAWNGLMLRTFAEAAAALGRQDYLAAAQGNAAFLLAHLRRDGRLLRSWKDGVASHKGYLEDHAFLADGLLALYEATFHRRWLEDARSLADAMLDLFWDDGVAGFYDTGRDHETLVVRPREMLDNAMPCGSSVAADLLLRLALLTGASSYSARAAAALRNVQDVMVRFPSGAGHWLCALDFYLSTPKEIAIVGRGDDPARDALLSVVNEQFLPNRVVAGYDPREPDAAAGIPLLEGKGMVDSKATAYVCQSYACQLPVTDPEALGRQLG
ncbi:MAG: thioredoxin domain-containing protein [Chloroflexi bacterium]|nr:thioredoxin domain-containing protein [Chloroflexota bacterium]